MSMIENIRKSRIEKVKELRKKRHKPIPFQVQERYYGQMT